MMASWNADTERMIRGLFMNRFAPKQYKGVMGVMMVMGELVDSWGDSRGRKNDNIGNGGP